MEEQSTLWAHWMHEAVANEPWQCMIRLSPALHSSVSMFWRAEGRSACETTKNAALGFGKGSALHLRRYLCVVTQQLVLVFEQLDEVVRGRRVEAFLGEEVLEK